MFKERKHTGDSKGKSLQIFIYRDLWVGTGGGNRTRVTSLGSSCPATERRPRGAGNLYAERDDVKETDVRETTF